MLQLGFVYSLHLVRDCLCASRLPCWPFQVPQRLFLTCHVPTQNSTGSNPPPRLDVTLRDMGLKNVRSLKDLK